MEFRFYVFTNLSTNPTHSVGTPRAFASRHHIFRCTILPAAFGNRRPPVAVFFVVRFYLPLYFTGDLRGRNLFVLRIYRHFLFGTTSGGPIFRCTTKDRGERRAKGIAIPLNPRGNVLGHSDVLCAYLFATVHLTRLSRAWRAPHCFHALCVLRCHGR